MVISLLHDAQELAIISGEEILNLDTLEMAYQERLQMMHQYIQPSILTNQKTSTTSKKKRSKKTVQKVALPEAKSEFNIYELAMRARKSGEDMVELLREYVSVLEVEI